MKQIKLIFTSLIILSLFVNFDLGNNFFNNLITNTNDGLLTRGLFSNLIFGDSLWTLEKFLSAFQISILITIVLCTIVNTINIYCYILKKTK